MDDQISMQRYVIGTIGSKEICGLPNSWDLIFRLAELADHQFYLETLSCMNYLALGAQAIGRSYYETDKLSDEDCFRFEKAAMSTIYRAGLAVLLGGVQALLLNIEFPPQEHIPNSLTAQEKAHIKEEFDPFFCHWDE